MKVERIFLVKGRVRPIWRFFISVPVVLVAMIAAERTRAFVFGSTGLLQDASWSRLLALPALLAGFWVLTRVFDRRPLGSVGLAFCGRWHLELGMGLGIGTLMIFLVAALGRVLGAVHFSLNAEPPGRLLSWGVSLLVFLLVAATVEELIFRGYPFQRLADSIGGVAAVAVFSTLFGLAHLGNPYHTLVSTLNTMLVGVPLAVAYLRTRALWMPVGIHFAWNYCLGYGCGLPVSGWLPPLSVLKATAAGTEWLTGGNYGPEGGVLATGVILIAAVYLSLSKSIYVSDEMRELVFGPTAGKEPPPVSIAFPPSPPAPAHIDRDERS